MKRITKWFMVIMVMSMFFGLTAQAAVKKLTIISPEQNSIVWTGFGAAANVPIKAKVTVSGGTSKALTYQSSNPNVASVNSTGVITGKKAGKVTITIATKDKPRKTTNLKISVMQKAKKVTPNRTSVNLNPGKSVLLTATYSPASSAFERWAFTSSNPKVATVDKNGKVTAVGVGKAEITIKIHEGFLNGPDAFAKVSINVKPKYVTAIVPKANSMTVGVKATKQLIATVLPADATNQKLSYKIYDKSIAKISNTGLVTGLKVGKTSVSISATDGSNVSTKVTVKVTKVIPVTSVKLDIKRTRLTVGGARTKSTGSYKPANGTIKSEKYTSSNPKVATVNQNGWVKPISGGTAIITYTVVDGTGKARKASVTVNVRVPVTGIKIAPANMTLYDDELGGATTGKATVTILPANATNKGYILTSSNPSVAVVAKDGTITAKAAGEVTITATSADGKKTASMKVTVIGIKEVIKVTSGPISNKVTLKANSSIRWTGENVRTELNRLLGDLVKVAGSFLPASAREVVVEHQGMTYKFTLSESGFSFTNVLGEDVFHKFNGKEFGEVILDFEKGVSQEQLQNAFSGISFGLARLSSNTYKLDGELIMRRGVTYVLSDVVLQNGQLKFKVNGKQAKMTFTAAGELVISNAPEFTNMLLDYYNGLLVRVNKVG